MPRRSKAVLKENSKQRIQWDALRKVAGYTYTEMKFALNSMWKGEVLKSRDEINEFLNFNVLKDVKQLPNKRVRDAANNEQLMKLIIAQTAITSQIYNGEKRSMKEIIDFAELAINCMDACHDDFLNPDAAQLDEENLSAYEKELIALNKKFGIKPETDEETEQH